MLVDDMPAMRSIVRGMLEEIGFARVFEVEDGDIAWKALQQSAGNPARAFGLIIADWNMPGMSGVDLLRAIRSFALTRDLPFFMITAQGDDAHIHEALRAGVTDYLVKPFTGPHLVEKIRQRFEI